MDLAEAVKKRISTRAFKPDPVPGDVVRRLLELAAQAPSGGNLQPWRVYALAGAPLAEFKALVATSPMEAPEYDVYPPSLWEPFRTRRFVCGEDLYASIEIPREDRPARLRQLARNGAFFDAPVGLFFCLDRKLGPPQWSDLGMFMQTFMLAATAEGSPPARRHTGRAIRRPSPVSSACRTTTCCSPAWRSATPTRPIRSTTGAPAATRWRSGLSCAASTEGS